MKQSPQIDLRPLADLVRNRLPLGKSAQSLARAERFMRDDIIESPQFGDIPFDDGRLWVTEADRSRARYAHGFLFLADWPTFIASSTDPPSIARRALALAQRWEQDFPQGSTDSTMAYHDEATAQRLTVHLALLPVFEEHLDPDDVAWFHAFLDRTAALLVRDDFHAGVNNHGMFQDLALVNYAALAAWREDGDRCALLEVALRRLKTYFVACFTDEGVHVENTPTYHVMVARHVRSHAEALQVIHHEDAPVFEELMGELSTYATHAIMPNGIFPPVSDTQQVSLVGAATSVFTDPEFMYAATQGRSGRQPADRVLVLPHSGYAIYRSAWGDPGATYVYFHAAFNNGYHKHADENSFVMRSGGVDLISEAGPYGYNYQDPLTRYGYSQFAHNTLVVNGVSIPRTGNDMDAVTMNADAVRADGFTVTGRNARLDDTVHERTLTIEEVDGTPRIDVLDTITRESESDARYELLWNVGAETEVVVHGHGFELFHQGTKVMDAMFHAEVPLSVSVRRAQTKPTYLGWRFPRFGQVEPADVVRVAFRGGSTQVRTTLRLTDFSYRDRGLADPRQQWHHYEQAVGLNYKQVDATSEVGARRLVVVFTAIHQPGDFTYNYRATVDQTPFHALYLLDDFGDQGAYYLQDHGDRGIFDTVQSLISTTLVRLGLTPSDLVTVGSSKGGTAALIHGLAAGAGHIFVGAPQTRIGSFVAKPHPNLLELMTGGTGPEQVAELDKALYDLAVDVLRPDPQGRGSGQPLVSIVVGDADHHYKRHVLPFVEHLRRLGNDPTVVVLPGLRHADIGAVYRESLRTFLTSLAEQEPGPVDASPRPLAIMATRSGDGVTALALGGGWERYAGRLFRDTKQVGSLPYSSSPHLTWSNLPPGRYRVRVFARNGEDTEPTARTTDWVVIS
ncbi:MAG: heparinase II/III family protein [Pedococcus sp.]